MTQNHEENRPVRCGSHSQPQFCSNFVIATHHHRGQSTVLLQSRGQKNAQKKLGMPRSQLHLLIPEVYRHKHHPTDSQLHLRERPPATLAYSDDHSTYLPDTICYQRPKLPAPLPQAHSLLGRLRSALEISSSTSSRQHSISRCVCCFVALCNPHPQ